MIFAVVSGHLGRDAETRQAGSTEVVSFSVASSGFRNKEKVTDWVAISMFGDRAKKIVQYLTKGSSVICRGTMFVREYDAKDGTRKFSLELRADDIELVGGKSKEDGSGGSRSGGGGGGGSSRRQTRDDAPPADDFGGVGGDDDIPF